jgi:hypothetical protein
MCGINGLPLNILRYFIDTLSRQMQQLPPRDEREGTARAGATGGRKSLAAAPMNHALSPTL